MTTPTYDLIESVTLTTSASSVTFSTIPQDYRDLVLVVDLKVTGNLQANLRFNGDTGTNYFRVQMSGDGSSPFSNSGNNDRLIFTHNVAEASHPYQCVLQIMDYTATDKHKSALNRENKPTQTSTGAAVKAAAHRWANTSAITTILLYSSTAENFAAGSTFHLYGIVS